jgi:hypothetical protein
MRMKHTVRVQLLNLPIHFVVVGDLKFHAQLLAG